MQIVFPILIVAISVGVAFIFNDLLWGLLTLITGFLNAYYLTIGSWLNYVAGFAFSGIYGYVCYTNGLYGFAIFTVAFYLPIQIYGIVTWLRHKDNDGHVLIKSLSLKQSLIIYPLTVAVCVGVGFLLNLIPSQQFALLDATSQVINFAGLIFLVMRFCGSWYLFLLNNIIDLAIWIIEVTRGGNNAIMTLITSSIYLVGNIIGLVMWIKIERKQKKIGNFVEAKQDAKAQRTVEAKQDTEIEKPLE